jgi:hypothetical protein
VLRIQQEDSGSAERNQPAKRFQQRLCALFDPARPGRYLPDLDGDPHATLR